jgi:peptide/nickel transport system permease protein
MILSLREREFIYTAYFSNMSTLKIVSREYLPHVLPWILASFIGRILGAIGLESTLAIFGLVSMTEITIGTMIFWSLHYQSLIRGVWWWISAPVMTVALLFISLYLVSTSVSEYLDPRSRIKRQKGIGSGK